MIKSLSTALPLAALMALAACGGDAPADTPATTTEKPVLRGSTDTTTPETPAPTPAPAGVQISDTVAGETTRFALKPDRWNANNGALSGADEGLVVTLEDKGNLSATTGTPVNPGDTYVGQLAIDANGAQWVRVRVLRGCDRTEVEQTMENFRLSHKMNDIKVSHTFANAHKCARIQVDAANGPSDFTITKATLTKTN